MARFLQPKWFCSAHLAGARVNKASALQVLASKERILGFEDALTYHLVAVRGEVIAARVEYRRR